MRSPTSTGPNDPYNGLEIQMVDLKKLNFDEPGLRTIELQDDFTPEDIPSQAKPLAVKGE